MNESPIIQVELYHLTERQNYRQEYDQAFVESIAGNMAAEGFKVEYPITVYREGDQFVVIDGHTRREAALLGSTYDVKEHKARMLVWVVVKDKPTDAQFKLDQLAANEQRRDPDDMSKAIGYRQALDAGATMDQLCAATGHKQPYIDKRLSFLKLTREAQVMVSKGQLSPDYAAELVRLKSDYQCAALSAYTRANRCDLVSFREIVDDLYTKQVEAEQTQLPMFGGELETYTAALVETLEQKRQISRDSLQKELDAIRALLQAEKAQHEANKRKAVIKLRAMQMEIETLRAQNDLLKKVS